MSDFLFDFILVVMIAVLIILAFIGGFLIISAVDVTISVKEGVIIETGYQPARLSYIYVNKILIPRRSSPYWYIKVQGESGKVRTVKVEESEFDFYAKGDYWHE